MVLAGLISMFVLPIAQYPPLVPSQIQVSTQYIGASSDVDNPGPDEIYRIVRDTLRIAVVGLSRDPSKPARRIPSYLAAKGAEVIPVNPFADRILGRVAHASLDDVEEPVDMVLVFRPSDDAGDVIRAAMSRPEKGRSTQQGEGAATTDIHNPADSPANSPN